MTNEDFRKRLRKVRKIKEWTSVALAKALQKPTNYISKIENGKIEITVLEFFNICNKLDIEPKDFFNEDYHFQTTRYKKLYKKIEEFEKEDFLLIQKMVYAISDIKEKIKKHG